MAGDVVVLNSGGPRMTVVAVRGRRLIVRWGWQFSEFDARMVYRVGRERPS